MPEVRQDPLTGRRVIIAEDRAGRPDEFDAAPIRHIPIDCPFCVGNEDSTPQSLAQYPARPAPWQVRVVPNKYPATGVAAPTEEAIDNAPAVDCLPADSRARQRLTDAGDLFPTEEACGAHEVIIESPRHVSGFSELTSQQAKWTFTAFRDRLRAAQEKHRYAIVFKNMGATAGASLLHAHSQLIALSFVPPDIQTQVANATSYYKRYGSKLLCDQIAQETETGERVVARTARYIAYCPFASRFAFEVWIAATEPVGPFTSLSCEDLAELAALTQGITRRLETVLSNPAYNMVLHAAPFGLNAQQEAAQQWRIEIFPRITRTAGFEWGAGCFINPVQPQRAAEELRHAMKSQPTIDTETGQSVP